MTVYADVLVALNILLTYILIVASRVLCKIPTNRWAVMFASFIGGFSSLIIFWEDSGVVFSVFYKLLTGAVISALAFLPKNIKVFLKSTSAFFGVSFLFAGVMFGVELTFNPENIMFSNGTVYFDMSISYLVGSVLSVYGIFLLAECILERKATEGGKCHVEITRDKKTVSLTGFVDTGNFLTDGVSGRPVIIGELSSLSPLFTREEFLCFKRKDYENIPESMRRGMRLVPCSGVTGESLLLCFLPENVKIRRDEKVYNTSFCTVGVTDKSLSGGEYNVLLNSKIFENGREEKSYDNAII